MFNRNKPTANLDPWFQEHLSDYLDGALSTADRARMEQLLSSSAEARQALETMRWTVAMLHELPAPKVPRQFTLPVTQQVPARSFAPWMVWGLRGVAAAAAIAFVLLLAGTLLRQTPSATTAMQAPAAAPVAPTAMVAFQPSPMAPIGTAQSSAANGVPAPTQVMITVEPPTPTLEPQPTTAALSAAEAAPAPTEEPLPQEEPQATEVPDEDNQAPAPAAAPSQATPTLEIANASAADNQAPPSNKSSAAASSLPTETAAAFSSRRALGPGIDGTVTASQLKVRAGPGTEYHAIGGLRRGDKVLAVGRSENNGWLKVNYVKDGKALEGWIGAAFVKLQAPIEELPIEVADLPPPTPEPTSVPPTVENSPTPLPTSSAPGKPTATPIVNVTAQPTANLATPTSEPTEQPTPADFVAPTTPTPEATPIVEQTVEPPELLTPTPEP